MNDRVASLDLVRGMAAIAVFTGHLRSALFVDYAQLESSNLIIKLFYAFTSLGHEAVVIFFVMSGYLVGGSVIKNHRKFIWSSYFISRLARLWSVLIPALVLTAVIDNLISQYYPGVINGGFNKVWGSGPVIGEYSNSYLTLIGNIFFQMTIFVPIFGTNSPLWSLSNEFLYYCLFPLSLCLLKIIPSRCSRLWLYGFGILVTLLLMLLPYEFLEGFFIFCMGGFVSFLVQNHRHFNVKAKFNIWLGFIIFIASIALTKLFQNNLSSIKDILIGSSFSLFLIVLVKVKIANEHIKKVSQYISDMSYSMYLTHFPLLILLALFWLEGGQLQPTALNLGIYVVFFTSVFIFSRLFWWLFERNTNYVRGLLMLIVQYAGARREI